MATEARSYEALRQAVAGIFMVDPASLGPQTTASDVPGWDSVSQVMLLMRIEDDFGLELDADALSEAADLQALAEFLDMKQAHASASRESGAA